MSDEHFYISKKVLSRKKDCKCCGNKIINRDKNANYCNGCSNKLRRIKKNIHTYINYLRQKNPGINIRVKINITKK